MSAARRVFKNEMHNNISQIKARLAAAKTVASPVTPVVDLSLADSGSIEADSTYLARVISTRLINPTQADRAAKIDLCLEALDTEGNRIGVLNEYLSLSPRSMRRMKEFLISADVVTEETYRASKLNAGELVKMLPEKMVGIVTRESPSVINDDGTPVIEVGYYIPAVAAIEQAQDEAGEGQD
jgi:hypothetical protein